MSQVKRRYDNARRREQALATRRGVVDAAGELFTSRGYAATSIDSIAARAGVSRDTIFKTFGNKPRLLQRWVEHLLAGATEPIPIAQQQWVASIRATSDATRQVEIAADAVTEIYDRAIDALITLRAAAHADPDIGELWQAACEQRRQDVKTVTALIASNLATTHDRSDDRVIDVVYTLTSPEMFELLVRQCGWSTEQFQTWLTNALNAALLDASAAPVPHHQTIR